MIETSKDLLKKFQPSAVYTSSDEISLLFPSLDFRVNERIEETGERQAKGPPNLAFRNSVQKIVSLTAGFCSVRFVHHLQSRNLTPQQRDLVSDIDLH
jgi:tRNA(His) 5'-end guanylyltransferase